MAARSSLSPATDGLFYLPEKNTVKIPLLGLAWANLTSHRRLGHRNWRDMASLLDIAPASEAALLPSMFKQNRTGTLSRKTDPSIGVIEAPCVFFFSLTPWVPSVLPRSVESGSESFLSMTQEQTLFLFVVPLHFLIRSATSAHALRPFFSEQDRCAALHDGAGSSP